MPTISKKTISYIIFLLQSELPAVYDEQPKHDASHIDTRIDYTNIILEKKLSGVGYSFSETLINFIRKGDAASVRELLYGLGGIDNMILTKETYHTSEEGFIPNKSEYK